MNKHFLLGVISGMGPRVTLPFCNKIINLNKVKDQGHIPYVLVSDPLIDDRTKSILNNDIESVKNKLNSIIDNLRNFKITHLVILCNTAHYWKPYLNLEGINFIDIIELTKIQSSDKVMLLATEGTYKINLYNKYYNEERIIIPEDTFKKEIMTIIYNCKSGIDETDKLKELIFRLKEKYNFNDVILGCTELSILLEDIHFIENIQIIDPLFVAAIFIHNTYKKLN